MCHVLSSGIHLTVSWLLSSKTPEQERSKVKKSCLIGADGRSTTCHLRCRVICKSSVLSKDLAVEQIYHEINQTPISSIISSDYLYDPVVFSILSFVIFFHGKSINKLFFLCLSAKFLERLKK